MSETDRSDPATDGEAPASSQFPAGRAHRSEMSELDTELNRAAAHGLRNLLCVVRSLAEVAAHSVPAESELHTDLVDIHTAAVRATNLVALLARSEMCEALAPVEVDALLGDFSSILKHLTGPTVMLQTELGAAGERALVDRRDLERALANLIVNARDAMDKGGTIFLRTTATPGRLRLTVSAQGHDMDDVTHAQAFDAYFTTKQHADQAHRGLAEVTRLIDRAGGRVSATHRPGAEMEVVVELPTVPTPSANVRPSAPRGPARSR